MNDVTQRTKQRDQARQQTTADIRRWAGEFAQSPTIRNAFTRPEAYCAFKARRIGKETVDRSRTTFL